jgi:pimeloyl-ACP methyl ester carboxylesterase
MIDARVVLPDGRSVGYVDFGPEGQVPVLWCHGGPGSRFEPQGTAPAAASAGFRLVGIDRPGYGTSTLQPGRTIPGWVGDGLAVADQLGLERFLVVGVSTGGAYALALAARAPERVLGVVACCALADMRWADGKAMMSAAGTRDLWSAPDRAAAVASAEQLLGADGRKMFTTGLTTDALPPADLAFLADPPLLAGFRASFGAMFASGVQAYVDDRLADGPGWNGFDVTRIRCPVQVLHGELDTIVPVAHAHHTAASVPGAKLRVVGQLGHFSIMREIVAALREVAQEAGAAGR